MNAGEKRGDGLFDFSGSEVAPRSPSHASNHGARLAIDGVAVWTDPGLTAALDQLTQAGAHRTRRLVNAAPPWRGTECCASGETLDGPSAGDHRTLPGAVKLS